jgi:metal-sulfur cluster biosynthetic enzyme
MGLRNLTRGATRADATGVEASSAAAVRDVPDPVLGSTLGELDLVGDVRLDRGLLHVTVWRPAVGDARDAGLQGLVT